MPTLRYHRAFPFNDDRWLVAKTHYFAVFGPNECSVQVIDVASGKSLASLPCGRYFMPPRSSIAVSDAAGLLAIQASDGTVRLWRREDVERYVDTRWAALPPSPKSITAIGAAVKVGIAEALAGDAAAADRRQSPPTHDPQP